MSLPSPSVRLLSRVILVPEGEVSTRLNWLRCGWVMATVTSRSPTTKAGSVMFTDSEKMEEPAMSAPPAGFAMASVMPPVPAAEA